MIGIQGRKFNFLEVMDMRIEELKAVIQDNIYDEQITKLKKEIEDKTNIIIEKDDLIEDLKAEIEYNKDFNDEQIKKLKKEIDTKTNIIMERDDFISYLTVEIEDNKNFNDEQIKNLKKEIEDITYRFRLFINFLIFISIYLLLIFTYIVSINF